MAFVKRIFKNTYDDLAKSCGFKKRKSSKALVCHDMKGGYLEDKFNNGCFDLSEEPYTFIHWSLIDTFVYFSHHFITIPPLGWIEAGHKNGVKILGTIITGCIL